MSVNIVSPFADLSRAERRRIMRAIEYKEQQQAKSPPIPQSVVRVNLARGEVRRAVRRVLGLPEVVDYIDVETI